MINQYKWLSKTIYQYEPWQFLTITAAYSTVCGAFLVYLILQEFMAIANAIPKQYVAGDHH